MKTDILEHIFSYFRSSIAKEENRELGCNFVVPLFEENNQTTRKIERKSRKTVCTETPRLLSLDCGRYRNEMKACKSLYEID